MNINEIFETLASNNSRNFKIDYLRENSDNEVLKKVIRLALDPFTNFYIRKIPNYTPAKPNQADSLDSVLDSLYIFSERKVTGNAGIEFLRKLLSSLTEDDAKVLERIIGKDLKCGVSTATINAVWEGLVQDFPVMLCSGYDKKLVDKITFPAIVQKKEDGARFCAIKQNGNLEFRTRNGKLLDFLGVLEKEFEAFPDGFVYDGELLVKSNGNILPRKEGNGIISKALKGTITKDEAEMVHVQFWDMIPYNQFLQEEWKVKYSFRFNLLKFVVDNKSTSTKISVVESTFVDSIEEAQEIFNDYLSQGFEGIILKDRLGIWENKRSKNQIKFKNVEELEAEVIDWLEGTGKYEGMLGSLTCKHNDIIFNLGTGFNDNDRKSIDRSIIGRVVTVKYNEIISDKDGNKSLFLPVYVETRFDKNEV